MAAETYPDDLKYHREHDWARIDGDEATLGITWSVKAVSDLIAPLSGEVVEVNSKVVEAPEIVNEDPYGEGWLIRIRLSESSEADDLLDAAAYRALLAEQ